MSVTTKEYTTHNFQIFDLLKYYQSLRIPKYQRDFSWETDDVEQLLIDIQNLFKEEGSTLFLGQFVFASQKKSPLPDLTKREAEIGGKVEIIDGQQRLTTLTLIYHVMLSKICKDLHPDAERAKYYNYDSLQAEIPHNRDNIGKLKNKILKSMKEGNYQSALLNESWMDQDVAKLQKLVKYNNEKHTQLWKIIFAEGHNHENNISQYNDLDSESWTAGDESLVSAYKIIFKYFEEMDEDDFIRNWVPVMFGLREGGTDRIHASVMHTSHPRAGIEIFYGINALGRQLNTADLIKAEIYSVAKKRPSSEGDRTATYMKRWEELEDLVSKKIFRSDNTNPFIDYLEFWITSDSGEETTKNKLYERFKNSNHLRHREDIDTLFNRLEGEAEIYFILRQKQRSSKICVFKDDHIKYDSLRKELNHIIQRLSLFLGTRGVQHLPILMYCFNQLRDNSQSKTVRFTSEHKIKCLIKITEQILLLMIRFKSAGVEAKTLRPKLFKILRELRNVRNADPESLYTTLMSESYELVKYSNLTENDYKYLELDSDDTSPEGTEESEKQYRLPLVRDNQIIDYLRDEYLTKMKKGRDLAKAIFWELEYRLATSLDNRYELMDPDDPHTHALRSKYDGDHIFPEKSEEYWKPLYDENKYNALLTLKYSLGNYMLLWSRDNRNAMNKPLHEKISSIFHTRRKTQLYLREKLVNQNLIEISADDIKIIDNDKLDKFWTKEEIEKLLGHYLEKVIDKFRYEINSD